MVCFMRYDDSSIVNNFYMSEEAPPFEGQPLSQSCAGLKPLFQKNPPKDIIKGQYALDVRPQIKLVSQQKKGNMHFVPPNRRCQELQQYMQSFNVFDYMGSRYAKMANQIVYLKFNNTKHHAIPKYKYKTRVMPALFLPFKQIWNGEFDKFTDNLNIEGLDNPNAYTPKAKHNKGCSFDPLFTSAYEGGNLFAAIRIKPYEYDLILQNDVNSCELISWFNFAVEFTTEGYYTFRIVNITQDMAQMFKNGLKIAYYYLNSLAFDKPNRAGQNWNFIGDNITFTTGSCEIENKPDCFYHELQFQFRCKNKHERLMFSLDIPYNPFEIEKFVDNTLVKKIRGMMKVDKIEYGKSFSGQPLESYLIKRKKPRGSAMFTASPVAQSNLESFQAGRNRPVNLSPLKTNNLAVQDNRNRSIVVLGRQSNLDACGNFMIEGMMDFVLDSMDYDSLKKTIDFHFFPLVNPDSVKYGVSKANLTGSLLERNWRNPSPIYHPQLHSLKEKLKQINNLTPIIMVLNLSAQSNLPYTTVLGVKNQNEESEDSRIFPFVLSKRSKVFSYEHSIFMEKNSNGSMPCVISEMLPKALVYQFNISRFEEQKNEEEEGTWKQCTPNGYRRQGSEVMNAYLEHIKIYDKNGLLREKWLREISEVEGQMEPNAMQFIEDAKVEERFHEEHYWLPVTYSPKIPSNKRLKEIRLKEMNQQKRGMNALKNLALKNFIDLGANDRDENQEPPGPPPEKPKPFQFRISDKNSLGKQILPSFKITGTPLDEIRERDPPKRDRRAFDKEFLKRDLSNKMLRKMRVEDAVREQKKGFLSP